MTHIPGVRSSSPSTSPVPKKPPPRGQVSKSLSQGPHSGNSPRGIKPPAKSDPSPAREPPGSQGGSSKASSRSGSRDSTPSRPPPQALTRPMQSPGRTSVSVSPGRNGLTPPNKLSQLPRTASPNTASAKSGTGRMAYTSPGRQMGQQAQGKQIGMSRSASGIPRSESASKSLNQCGASGTSKKVELSRMSSTKSSGSESDRSEKPGLVRQSTFIKEAPSPTLKRKLEESASFESLSPSSPSMSQSQTPVSSPSLPDMSLTLPYQGSGWRKSPHSQNSSENGDGKSLKRQDIARSHSESPSRLPINRTGTWKREHTSKHSSSLPRVGTWKRTGSSSSILSASSESSEKGRSEDERQPTSPAQRTAQGKEGAPLKGTWRKMKESDGTHAMTLDLPDQGADSGTAAAAGASKSEDVWVRIEDCPINNPRSAKSPTANTPPVIDSAPPKMPPSDPSEIHPKSPSVSHNVNARRLGSETNLNLLRSSESLDRKGVDIIKPAPSNPNIANESYEVPVATERTPFSSCNSSKHSSPSGAVAARVSPFNYTPSPRKSSADSTTPRPSQIPTPVTSGVKKRDSKGDTTESGSYIVTSV